MVCLLLAVVTAAVYWQLRAHAFLNLDDPEYVSDNPHLRHGFTPAALGWMLTSGYAGNWHPLTWLSHTLDWQLFGANAGAHLLVNLALHMANAVLLFIGLRRMTGALWRSALVAGLFALHPLHVESVAWVSERKDVLSAFFWMLALLSYHHYTRRPSLLRYGVVLVLFAGGLMAKPMVITLPLVFLLLDWWPLRRLVPESGGWRWLLLEKLPLLALSAASAAVTLVVQHRSGAIVPLGELPLWQRPGHAIVSYAAYLGKMCWPAGLSSFYPFHEPAAWQYAGATVLVVGLSALCWWQGRRRPWLFTGWFWYLGVLVPVIGLVQVGDQSMADRYTYLPLIGIFILVAWAGGE